MATLSEMVIKIGADASGLSAGLSKVQQDMLAFLAMPKI